MGLESHLLAALVALGGPGGSCSWSQELVSGCSKGWALQPGSSPNEHLPPLMSISPNEHLPSIFPNGHFPSLHRAVLLQARTPHWSRGIFFFSFLFPHPAIQVPQHHKWHRGAVR